MSIKIKVGSTISIEEYEDVGSRDLYDYSGDIEGVVIDIYDSNGNKVKESDTLEELKLEVNFNGELLEVDEGCYKIVKV
jgi:hypothetical protein